METGGVDGSLPDPDEKPDDYSDYSFEQEEMEEARNMTVHYESVPPFGATREDTTKLFSQAKPVGVPVHFKSRAAI